ncbi:MAG: nucleoside kinase [Clostridiales bacterium]|nr:nucleoside kinase [Clostridiales bacterium]
MVTVIIFNQTHNLNERTPAIKLIKDDDKRYMAVKVNNRLRELNFELYYDCEVTPLDLCSADAVKVYETSMRYLIALAFHNLHPDYQVKLSYGISRSILVTVLEPKVPMDKNMLAAVKAEMERLIAADIPFEKTVLSKEDAYKYFMDTNQTDKAMTLQYRTEKICHFYKCGDYLNYMYGYMVPSTGYLKHFNMFIYDKHFIVQYPRYEANGQIPKFKDEPTLAKVLKRAFKWAKLCNVDLIAKMNKCVEQTDAVDFINMNETLHNGMLHDLGGMIADDIENIRLICIAGPSSSGKTTFSNRLKIELMSRGINPLRISLDMYYKDRDQIPIDEFGEKDFEHIDALDVKLFNEHMQALIAGEEVELPDYRFGNGRAGKGIPTKIPPNTPIIIEGIHALNDDLSFTIPKHQKFKIYIAPQFQINIDYHNPISYTDIRLLRRIVRDKKYRASSAERTLDMWPSVRRGEFKWIYPYQEGCNYVYNSALTYELCVLKKYALPALQEVKPDSPYYITANRLIKFLKYFKDLDEKWVPCNSLLREFIGGSCFAEVDE